MSARSGPEYGVRQVTERVGRNPDTGTKRRCLVLAGGGAKGAYAYGCLKEFSNLGIRFESVAGTSVGALNAAIWSTQSFDIGDRLWNELSFETVLPVRNKHRRLPKFSYYIEGFVRVLVQMLSATWAGVPHPGHRFCAFVNSLLFVLPVVLIGITVRFPSPLPLLDDRLTWILSCVGVGIFSAWMLYKGQVESESAGIELLRALSFSYLSLMVLSPALAGILVPGLWKTYSDLQTSLGPLSLLVGLLFVVIVGVATVRVFSVIAEIATRVTRRPLFENSRLQSHVDGLLQKGRLQVPTLVCVAERKSVFARWIALSSIPGVYKTGLANTMAASTLAAWVPRYMDVREQTLELARRILLASAALPFGLLPSITVGGREFVDGGLADNVPIFPFVDDSTDEVFVVLLDHDLPESAEDWEELIRRQWPKTDLLLRRADLALLPMSIQASELATWNHLDLQARTVPRIPRIVVFRPSKPLGGFLRGTLNFDGGYAGELIALGQKDAMYKLRNMGLANARAD